jgi:hypothetical protein
MSRLLRCIIFSCRMSEMGQFLPPRLVIGMAGLASIAEAE